MNPKTFSFLVAALLICVCGAGLARSEVFRGDHPSYWIWAGITENDLPAEGSGSVYVFQGTFADSAGKAGFRRNGLFPYPMRERKHLHLVFRQEGRLPDPEVIVAVYRKTAEAWKRHAVEIRGLQIDADVPTSKLEAYGTFIESLRARLGKAERLSVTGLCDWLVNGDARALRRIASAADAIVFQFYQGRKPVADEAAYVEALKKADYPFMVGLLEKQNAPRAVADIYNHPYYRGTILFIQK